MCSVCVFDLHFNLSNRGPGSQTRSSTNKTKQKGHNPDKTAAAQFAISKYKCYFGRTSIHKCTDICHYSTVWGEANLPVQSDRALGHGRVNSLFPLPGSCIFHQRFELHSDVCACFMAFGRARLKTAAQRGGKEMLCIFLVWFHFYFLISKSSRSGVQI